MGINGRDCIQKADIYDYNLLNCFFQNDNTFYSPNEYLNGIVPTTGISRYNKKYDFIFYDNLQFTLTPKSTSDFSYSIELDEMDCPRLLNQKSFPSQCQITLSYANTGALVQAIPTNTSFLTKNVTFVNNTAQFLLGLSDWIINANGVDCFILFCQETLSVSTVLLKIPNVQIVSSADLALESQINDYMNNVLQERIDKMSYIQNTVGQVIQNINQLKANLSKIDFNVTAKYPYSDFTELRQEVDQLIGNIGADPAQGGRNCDGPWNNAVCWFKDFAGVLITISVVIVVTVVGYFIFKKTGLADKICAEKDNEVVELEDIHKVD
jgi:hypothetical protein